MSEIENKTETADAVDPEWERKAGARIDPILAHLNAPGAEIDKNRIRELFVKVWNLEKGETLSPEDQFLTTVGLFIYYAHNVLDDCNLKMDVAREAIANALREWLAPETNKAVAGEKTAADPFKAFVDAGVPKIDEVYTWRNFLLEHKKSGETEWTYKMKKCWFSEFLTRYGRPDYLLTACQFDMIPAEARKDYVALRLQNLFPKMGSSCQFTYTPVKKGS